MATLDPAASFGAPLINLMPRAEIERRARASLLRRWAWGIVVALTLVAITSGGAFALRFGAEVRLAAENLRTTALLTDLAALSDVRAAIALENELGDFRAQAMASEFDWRTLVAMVQDVTPAGVTIAGFDLAAGPVPAGDDPAAEVGAAGTFTFESATPLEIVPLIRAVRPLPGVMDADGWELTSEGETGTRTYTYILRVTVDQSIYTGAYAKEESE
ncbi:hypothetical protein [Microbacterium timonense]|uniref:hypothetical protein n=1 Tax=Microbacterium timonense TaxID=2086576 RepID=UPI000D112300|nr:hypothetical protein [Microbacterium timonense]